MMRTAKTGLVLALLLAAAGCTRSMPTISDRAASPIAAAPSGRVASSSLPPPPPPPPPPSAEVAANDPYAQPAGSPIIDQPGAGAPSSSAPTQTASAAPVTRESLVGAWKVTSGGGSCQIFMALTKWTGGYRAASRGCPGQVADVAAWDVSGSQVVLKDSGGTTVATLNSSGGTRYDGSTSAGQAISLYR